MEKWFKSTTSAARTTNKSLNPANNSVSGNNMTHNTLELKMKIIWLGYFIESKAVAFETFHSGNVVGCSVTCVYCLGFILMLEICSASRGSERERSKQTGKIFLRNLIKWIEWMKQSRRFRFMLGLVSGYFHVRWKLIARAAMIFFPPQTTKGYRDFFRQRGQGMKILLILIPRGWFIGRPGSEP